jgi:hypothetical protein
MGIESVPKFIQDHYEIHEWKHAIAIIENEFPEEWGDICEVLEEFRLRKSEVVVGGGGKTKIAKSIDNDFYSRGWAEKSFDTKIVVDEDEHVTPTHKVDCFKNKIALEVEWNNKDPFFDRDLNNFRLLFDLRTVSVGIIITRCDELQEIFDSLGKGKSYGSSTTHMGKLIPKIEGGGAGGCPVLVFGIKKELYVEDV